MQIFIGSSKLAKTEVEFVANVVTGTGMKPVRWYEGDSPFAVGKTLLETIERLPIDFHGAVLLVTPDPAPNVLVEFGYLAARLTRKRVAICRFGAAEIPSDLGGMKYVDFADYDYRNKPTELPNQPTVELSEWLRQIPHLAGGVPPVSQVHGYSGTWNIASTFSLWRGTPIEPDDRVYFEGKAFLVLEEGGERGSGIQVGKLSIRIGEYAATYDILNEIITASVDVNGTLRMLVKIVRREGPKEPPAIRLDEAKYPSNLPTKEFHVEVRPDPVIAETLTGAHWYRTATKVYQQAEEHWDYAHLFGSSCL
jgi:hypothetical protein